MVIKASTGAELRRLVDALDSADEMRREAAVARLAIIGSRAVDRLLAAYEAASAPDTRIAILRALERINDPRTLLVARTAMTAGGDEAIAAAAAIRGLLDSAHQQTAAVALDLLVAAALDAGAERRLRLAAFHAVQDMPPAVRDRLAAVLQQDSDPRIKAHAAAAAARAGHQEVPAAPALDDVVDAVWADALDGRLPDDPATLREALQPCAESAPLSALQKLLDHLRAREGGAATAARRADWQRLRGSLHQLLALRGSRIGLYDLRETLEMYASAPLPASFLAAAHAVGDASCLPPLAAAYARQPDTSAWRQQVAATFHAIVRRERITRRHAVMKRVASKWPAILHSL